MTGWLYVGERCYTPVCNCEWRYGYRSGKPYCLKCGTFYKTKEPEMKREDYFPSCGCATKEVTLLERCGVPICTNCARAYKPTADPQAPSFRDAITEDHIERFSTSGRYRRMLEQIVDALGLKDFYTAVEEAKELRQRYDKAINDADYLKARNKTLGNVLDILGFEEGCVIEEAAKNLQRELRELCASATAIQFRLARAKHTQSHPRSTE